MRARSRSLVRRQGSNGYTSRMADRPESVATGDRPTEAPVDVAATFARLREAVRQRAAEAATLEPGSEAAQSRQLALRELDTVREPVPVSPRRGLGRLVVFSRKAAFHLFLKWLVRPLLAQQNQFNQTAAQLIEELLRSEERLRGELRRQAALLERAGIASESPAARPPAHPAPGPGSDA